MMKMGSMAPLTKPKHKIIQPRTSVYHVVLLKHWIMFSYNTDVVCAQVTRTMEYKKVEEYDTNECERHLFGFFC